MNKRVDEIIRGLMAGEISDSNFHPRDHNPSWDPVNKWIDDANDGLTSETHFAPEQTTMQRQNNNDQGEQNKNPVYRLRGNVRDPPPQTCKFSASSSKDPPKRNQDTLAHFQTRKPPNESKELDSGFQSLESDVKFALADIDKFFKNGTSKKGVEPIFKRETKDVQALSSDFSSIGSTSSSDLKTTNKTKENNTKEERHQKVLDDFNSNFQSPVQHDLDDLQLAFELQKEEEKLEQLQREQERQSALLAMQLQDQEAQSTQRNSTMQDDIDPATRKLIEKISQEEAEQARLRAVDSQQDTELDEESRFLIEKLRRSELTQAPYSEDIDEDSLRLIHQLEIEDHDLAQRKAEEERSLQFIQELQRQEREEKRRQEEESERVARELLLNEGSTASDSEYDQYELPDLGEQVPTWQVMAARDLQQVFKEATLSECLRALEQSNFDINQAVVKLLELNKQFPKLGVESSMKTDTSTQRFGSANQVRASGTVYTVEVLSNDLLSKFPNIPPAGIRKAAIDSNGSLDRAEAILLNRFPAEFMNAQLSAQTRPSVASTNDDPRILKFRGNRLDKTPSMSSSISTSRSDSSPIPPSSVTDIDLLEAHYLARVEESESYSMSDLNFACITFGPKKQPDFHPIKKSSALRQDVVYDAARERSNQYRDAIAKLQREKGNANLIGRFDYAAELDSKIETMESKSLAARWEAADILLVRQNPELAWLVAHPGDLETDYLTITLDLHGLHLDEAKSRTLAVLEHAYRKGWKSLNVVTGKGNNSGQGGAKLLPGIHKLLSETRRFVDRFEEKPGSFDVRISRSR